MPRYYQEGTCGSSNHCCIEDEIIPLCRFICRPWKWSIGNFFPPIWVLILTSLRCSFGVRSTLLRCRELGIGIVPYSPLGRRFFGGKALVCIVKLFILNRTFLHTLMRERIRTPCISESFCCWITWWFWIIRSLSLFEFQPTVLRKPRHSISFQASLIAWFEYGSWLMWISTDRVTGRRGLKKGRKSTIMDWDWRTHIWVQIVGEVIHFISSRGWNMHGSCPKKKNLRSR